MTLSQQAPLVERLKSSAEAFRRYPVYTVDGDAVKLTVQADEADEAAARITELGRERDHWKRLAEDRVASANRNLQRARDTEAQCRVLQEALQPFAEDHTRWLADDGYDGKALTIEHFTRAVQALSLSGGGGREEKGSARADLSPASRSPEPSDLEDEIADALQDSLGPDWTCRDGAKAVVRLLEETRR